MIIRAGIFLTIFLFFGCSQLESLSNNSKVTKAIDLANKINSLNNTLTLANSINSLEENTCKDFSNFNTQQLFSIAKINKLPVIVSGEKRFICTCGNSLGLEGKSSKVSQVYDKWGQLFGAQENMYLDGQDETSKLVGVFENEYVLGVSEEVNVLGMSEKEALITGYGESNKLVGFTEVNALFGFGETSFLEGQSELFQSNNEVYSCRNVSTCPGFQLTGFGANNITVITDHGARVSSTSCVVI